MLSHYLNQLLLIVLPPIVLFFVIKVILKLMLKVQNEDLLVKTSIVLTGVIAILYVFMSGTTEGFEEVPNAEVVANDEEVAANISTNLNTAVDQLLTSEAETSVVQDGPTPNTSAAALNSTEGGLSNQPANVTDAVVVAETQPNVETTGQPEPMPVELAPRATSVALAEETNVVPISALPDLSNLSPETVDQELQAKYTIIPVNNWASPSAADLQNQNSCACSTVAPWDGAPLDWKLGAE